MTEILSQIQEASQRSDKDRLNRLHNALTKNLHISHYANLPPSVLEEAIKAVDRAMGVRAPKPDKPRAPRVRKPIQPLDLSTFEQSDLFADSSRWPRRPYCTDDPRNGLWIRSLRQAIERPYIQANPPHLRVWALFDIDRPDAALAWEQANLPPPAWTSVNKVNGHAHSAWGLSAPVLVDGLGARDAPMRFLCAVESMMREALQADNGYSGLTTKNPAHPLWRTLRGPRMHYELSELAEWLPGIEKYRPKRKAPEEIGLGRNVALFDKLRKWAYSGIRPFWGGGLDGWNAWLSNCNSRGLVFNSDFQSPLGGKEVWHIARSVAKWTWRNTTAEGFSQWQAVQGSKGGKASGVARYQASEDKRSSARLMQAAGSTQVAIAQELGVHVNTVANWLR